MKRSRLLSFFVAFPALLFCSMRADATYSERSSISAAVAETDATNLVTNGSFESSLTNWTKYPSTATITAISGAGLTTTGTTPGTSYGANLVPKGSSISLYQDEIVESGERYLVVAWARCKSTAAAASASVRFLDDVGYITSYKAYEQRADFASTTNSNASLAWQPTMFMVTVPWNATRLRVILNATGGTSTATQGFVFDEVQLYGVADDAIPPLATLSVAPPDVVPGTYVSDDAHLQAMKAELVAQGAAAQTPDFANALNQIKGVAQDGMDRTTYLSVVADGRAPAGGTVHDYYTLATYWWPDQDDIDNGGDGLPYIRKDGQTNPETNDYWDQDNVATFCKEVKAIALAHYFTDDSLSDPGDPTKAEYAAQAIEMIRVWFINSATKMNPHIKHSQVVKGMPGSDGVNGTGFGSGTIDTERLVDVIDAIQILRNSPGSGWTTADQNSMESWFTSYLNWMLTSAQGLDAGNDPNNIRTHYELQIVACQMFLGQTATARARMQNVIMPLISSHFGSTGEQLNETIRTKPWDYSVKNLNAWFRMATVAKALGIDLWNKTYTVSGNSRSIKEGFTWLLGFAKTPSGWAEGGTVTPNALVPAARTASVMWPDLKSSISAWGYLVGKDAGFLAGNYQSPFGAEGVLLTQPYGYLPDGM